MSTQAPACIHCGQPLHTATAAPISSRPRAPEAALAAVLLVAAVWWIVGSFVVYIDTDVLGFGTPRLPWSGPDAYRVVDLLGFLARWCVPLAAVGLAVWLLVSPRRLTSDVAGAAVAVGVLVVAGTPDFIGTTFLPAALMAFVIAQPLVGTAAIVLGLIVVARSGGPMLPAAVRYPALALSAAAYLLPEWLILTNESVLWDAAVEQVLKIAVVVLVTLIAGGAGLFGFLLVQLQIAVVSVANSLALSAYIGSGGTDFTGNTSRWQTVHLIVAILLVAAFVLGLVGRLRARQTA